MRTKDRKLKETLYCYVTKKVQMYARGPMTKKWGSFSNYVNYLIAKDAGDKESMKVSRDLRKIHETPAKQVRKAKPGKKKRAKTRTKARKASTKSRKRSFRKNFSTKKKPAKKSFKQTKRFIKASTGKKPMKRKISATRRLSTVNRIIPTTTKTNQAAA